MEIKTDASTVKRFLKFFIPSLIGVILFMIPVCFNGNLTIPIAIFSNLITEHLGGILPLLITITITLTFLISLITKILKPNFILNNSFLNNLFNVSTIWFIGRTLGAFFALCAYFKIGPSLLFEGATANFILYELLPILFAVFLFAGLLLPLVLDFGLLEFFGTLLTKVMRPVFKLPGRSAVDCVTSWLGDGTIGVLLTSKQYEDGYYSKREAAIIGTNFSAVSITFCLLVISQVKLDYMFVPFYLTVTFTGIIAAIITPRLPPLNKIPDTYFNDKKSELNEEIPEGHTSLSWGLEQALNKASQNNSFGTFIKNGIKNSLDMWVGVTPIVMAMGTLALIIAKFTPIFKWLGLPFIPFLKLLQIPEAAHASQTLVVGFADMFLPSVIGASIKSDLTRFVIACVSVTQLIYMSEVGGLLLGSKIPVKFKDLVYIFLIRTLLTLPIISLIAHILF